MAKYRILSLDGGGSWALLQVMALKALYSGATSGHQVLADFDLAAANSGGSIVLGALIENKTLDQILNDYFLSATQRGRIFVEASFFHDPMNLTLRNTIGIGAKYDAAAKLAGLRQALPGFGDVPFANLPGKIQAGGGRSPHFLICTFDFDRKRARYFRSNVKSRAASSAHPPSATLAQAIHASSNAPVNYFDAPAAFEGCQYWDGGVSGNNNPILAAITEALANGARPADIAALSIGTGTVAKPLASGGPGEDPRLVQPLERSSVVHDLHELATSILDDPPDAASFIAYVALGQPLPDPDKPQTVSGSLVRMNGLIQPVRPTTTAAWQPPKGFNVADFDKLANLDMDAVKDPEVQLIQRFGDGWIAGDFANQAIRSNSETRHCEIGQATFAEALQAWKQVRE